MKRKEIKKKCQHFGTESEYTLDCQSTSLAFCQPIYLATITQFAFPFHCIQNTVIDGVPHKHQMPLKNTLQISSSKQAPNLKTETKMSRRIMWVHYSDRKKHNTDICHRARNDQPKKYGSTFLSTKSQISGLNYFPNFLGTKLPVYLSVIMLVFSHEFVIWIAELLQPRSLVYCHESQLLANLCVQVTFY